MDWAARPEGLSVGPERLLVPWSCPHECAGVQGWSIRVPGQSAGLSECRTARVPGRTL